MKPVVFRSHAEKELDEGVAYYESTREGLGQTGHFYCLGHPPDSSCNVTMRPIGSQVLHRRTQL
jgi:hypothetical protein